MKSRFCKKIKLPVLNKIPGVFAVFPGYKKCPVFLDFSVRSTPWKLMRKLRKFQFACFFVPNIIFSVMIFHVQTKGLKHFPADLLRLANTTAALVCRSKYGRFLGHNIIVNVRKIAIFSN